MKHLDTLPAIGCCLILAALWSSTSHAKPPERPVVVTTIAEPAAYLADPRAEVYHSSRCFYVNPNTKQPMLEFASEQQARNSGRHACEHCCPRQIVQAR
jgi:hypothetical protein